VSPATTRERRLNGVGPAKRSTAEEKKGKERKGKEGVGDEIFGCLLRSHAGEAYKDWKQSGEMIV
jgi:hypothetical protein